MTERPRPVASARHTAILIGIFLVVAGYGSYLQQAAGNRPHLVEGRGSALPLYLSLIAMEWGLLRYVVVGLKRTGTRLRDILGAGWATPAAAARDAAIALAAWIAWTAIESAAARLLGPDAAKGIDTLLPRGAVEVGAWVALAVSAGICEEAVFRGYLQRQLEALAGGGAVALVGQAIVFGIAHGYQGLRNVITIAILGLGYGLLARWRRSLRPGMVLHAWMDVFGGIFATRH